MSAVSITLIIIASLCVLTYLAVRSGDRYGHQDAHVHSEEYAGIIREGHGPLTVFLIIAFLAIFLWTGVYFFQHAGEFRSGSEDSSVRQSQEIAEGAAGS